MLHSVRRILFHASLLSLTLQFVHGAGFTTKKVVMSLKKFGTTTGRWDYMYYGVVRSHELLMYASSRGSTSFDGGELERRLTGLRTQISRIEENRPPNPSLSPQQVVRSLLSALLVPDDPVPEAGFRLLLQSATPKWRHYIRQSVGAPEHASVDQIASALGAALSRPNNQFGILVDAPDDESSSRRRSQLVHLHPLYNTVFPTEVVDFDDGNCWIECRLRGRLDDKLLVIMGWQMKKREEDGSWLIDGLDWQDFRDGYRPGIGREEWLRICG